MSKEEKEAIINLYDSFLYKNSSGSCRPRERSLNIEDAMNGLMDILNSFVNVNNVIWHDRDEYPETDIKIIVKDKEGKEYDDHTWNGYCYYEWIEHDDGTGDGWRIDVDVVSWKYDNNIKL